MRDIMAATNPALADIPWGGKVVVLGGDFRQILPVVTHGRKADIIAATLNQSPLWRHVQVLKLHKNMRVQRIRDAGDSHERCNHPLSICPYSLFKLHVQVTNKGH